MKIRLVVSLVGANLLLSCSPVGPDYTPPKIDVATRFVDGDATSAGEMRAQQWWRSMNDSNLNALVSRGLNQNLDVRSAIERINEAQAVLRSTGSAAQISGSVTGTAGRADSGSGAGDSSSGTLSASYVFDMFGGIRRGREAAAAGLESAVYDVGTARLALLTELVADYIYARYYQEAIALTRQSIETRRQTLALTEGERDLGISSSLDYANAEAILNDAIADLPALETGFYTSVYAIATLLNEPAAPLLQRLQSGAPQPRPGRGSAAGIPADVLRNRPDINTAERDLAEATANVGVAVADLYPSIDLDGSVTAADSGSWSFGPTLTFPFFNQPALRSARDQQISLARQAELTWRSSVMTAVEEVQSAQTTFLRLQREVSARQAAAASYQRVVDLSRETYDVGTTSLLDLLDAEQSNAEAQLLLAEAVRSLAETWASLQIAAGRGWQMP